MIGMRRQRRIKRHAGGHLVTEMSPKTLQIFDSDRTDVDEISRLRKRTGTELAHYPLSGRTSCSSFSSNKLFCITSVQSAPYVSGLKLSIQTRGSSSRVKAASAAASQPRSTASASTAPRLRRGEEPRDTQEDATRAGLRAPHYRRRFGLSGNCLQGS